MSHSSDSNHNLTLHEKILKQIEYYLSGKVSPCHYAVPFVKNRPSCDSRGLMQTLRPIDHNLLTDTFLRKKLNESPQKEVPLSLFTKFPRMASICTDIPTIADALRQSTRLYVNNTGTTVRRRIPFNGKKASDIVCKMFAAGKCKYGKKCRFKHEMGEDTGLGGWAAVEPTEEKSTRKRGLEDTELESGLAKQTAEINPLKRQRVGEASAAGQSRTERLDAPATRNNSTAPAVSTAIPDATFPIPTLSIHTALAAWGAAHFGASARHRFPALPLPPSAYTAQTHSSDSNGWNTMCANCHMYWTDHYKQEGWVADESYGMVDADDGAEQAEDADNGAYLGEEEDEGGYDEEEGSFLTPEMIEIFRHSENWKREREWTCV